MFVISTIVLVLAAPGGTTSTERAEKWATRAVEHHSAGRFREAAEAFRRAFALSGIHVQLRNAAKSYSEAGEIESAVRLWLEVLAHPDATPADQREAHAFLTRLREVPERPAPPPPAVPDARPDAREATVDSSTLDRPPPPVAHLSPAVQLSGELNEGESIVWWVVGGLAVVAAMAGGGLLASSRADLSDLDAALAQKKDGRIVGVAFEDAERRLSGIRRDHAASAALLGVGGAGLIASTLAFSLDW